MTYKQFADILVRNGVVDTAAVDDPEGYDNGWTLQRIKMAYDEVQDVLIGKVKEVPT